MVEHEYCLRWKVLNEKSSKGEKLQVDRTALAGKIDITLAFSPYGYGVISGL